MNIVKAIRGRGRAETRRPEHEERRHDHSPSRSPPTTAEIGGIGHSVKRHEDDRFVAGQGNYLDDHTLPGMLHMAILRSPVAARAHQRASTRRRRRRSTAWSPSSPASCSRSYGLAWMPTMSGDTQAVLATDKVRFQGQEVAAVVATDPYIAEDALELIDVDYEILPAITSPQQALADGAVRHPRRQGGPDRQPRLRVGERRRGRDRRGVRRRPTGSSRSRRTTRARTRRRWRRAASSPTSTPSPARRRST